MRAKFIYEKFKKESDPIKDMGIGVGLIYDIEKIKEDEDSYNFTINISAVKEFLRKHMPKITDNEIDRFMAYELDEIIKQAPITFFRENNEKALDRYIKNRILNISPYWLGIHGDEAMRKGMNF